MKYLTVIIFAVLLFGCSSETEPNSDEKIPRASMDEIETGIKSYIDREQKRNDGYFIFENDTAKYKMRLVRVHTEYLSNLGPGKYFACVDLAVENGNVYDVDFFLEGEPGNMKVVRTSLHKLNGKPYYTWKQNKEENSWETVPVDKADFSLLGVIEEKDTFNFSYSVHLPEIKGTGRIWIPVAQNNAYQDVAVVSNELPESAEILEDDAFGNRAYFIELDTSHSGQTLDITYAVDRTEKAPYKATRKAIDKRYLSSNTLIPVNERFREIALSTIADTTDIDTLMLARSLYDYVIDSMKYIKAGKYGTGDAAYACDAQSGNCSEFHSYFIALARSAGIPARFAIGAAIPSNRDEGGVNGYHCWAEFYANGKWWPVDISEANKYSDLATYYFGHHPANRIEFSRGRDIDFQPGPASGAINFFAYPIMEIDSAVVRPEVEFSFERHPQKP